MTATSQGSEEEELMMQLETCILIIDERARWRNGRRERERRDAGDGEVVSAEAGDRYLVQGRSTAGVVTEEGPLVQ